MDTMTLVCGAVVIVLVRTLLAVTDRIRGLTTLPEILAFFHIATRSHPFITKTGIPAREKRWPLVPMPPSLPTTWSLYDMVKRMEERARALGMTDCDVTLKLENTIGPNCSDLAICVKDASNGREVWLSVSQFGAAGTPQIEARNMDCTDLGWDVDTLSFYSRRDREKHKAYLKECAAIDKLKQGSHDDN